MRVYEETKTEFEAKYGNNTYNRCYDVFGVLSNEAYLTDLKKLYKALALHFLPDRSGDDGEMMKFVNRVKEDWRI